MVSPESIHSPSEEGVIVTGDTGAGDTGAGEAGAGEAGAGDARAGVAGAGDAGAEDAAAGRGTLAPRYFTEYLAFNMPEPRKAPMLAALAMSFSEGWTWRLLEGFLGDDEDTFLSDGDGAFLGDDNGCSGGTEGPMTERVDAAIVVAAERGFTRTEILVLRIIGLPSMDLRGLLDGLRRLALGGEAAGCGELAVLLLHGFCMDGRSRGMVISLGWKMGMSGAGAEEMSRPGVAAGIVADDDSEDGSSAIPASMSRRMSCQEAVSREDRGSRNASPES